jgi:hypothetical protein
MPSKQREMPVPDLRPTARRLCVRIAEHVLALIASLDLPDSVFPPGTLVTLAESEARLETALQVLAVSKNRPGRATTPEPGAGSGPV